MQDLMHPGFRGGPPRRGWPRRPLVESSVYQEWVLPRPGCLDGLPGAGELAAWSQPSGALGAAWGIGVSLSASQRPWVRKGPRRGCGLQGDESAPAPRVLRSSAGSVHSCSVKEMVEKGSSVGRGCRRLLGWGDRESSRKSWPLSLDPVVHCSRSSRDGV